MTRVVATVAVVEHDELSGMPNFVLNMIQEARNQYGIAVLREVRKQALCQHMIRVIFRRHPLGGSRGVDGLGLLGLDGSIERRNS